MVQIVRTFALTATIALAGCLGPVPGSDEWVAIQKTKSAEFLRQCNASGATDCSYTYSYTKADNWFDYFINSLADASSSHTPVVATHSARHNLSNDNSDLVFICGSAGMGVDFVTGSCVSSSGSRTSPYNLYHDFQAPLPTPPSPGDAIMRCGGRGVNFVTGKCF